MSPLANKGVRAALMLLGFCSVMNPGHAAEVAKNSAAMARLLSGLYPIFPAREMTPDNERPEAGDSEWNIIIRAINEARECTYDDFTDICRGHILHFVVSEDNLGGASFSFRVGPAFFVHVVSFRQIPAESNGGRSCVLFTLEERVKVNPKHPRWEEKITHICATPRGFVKYRPAKSAGAKP